MTRLFIVFLLLCCNCSMAQVLEPSKNISIEEISLDEYNSSYVKHGRNKRIIKSKRKGKKAKSLFSSFLKTDTGKRLYDNWGEEILSYMYYYNIPQNTNQYLIEIESPVNTRSYLIHNDTRVDTLEMLGGSITAGGILFAYDDFGEETILCKWYSFEGNKASQIAELKEKTHEYYIPQQNDMPSFFYGIDGCYYLRIKKKWIDCLKYYRLKLTIENETSGF